MISPPVPPARTAIFGRRGGLDSKESWFVGLMVGRFLPLSSIEPTRTTVTWWFQPISNREKCHYHHPRISQIYLGWNVKCVNLKPPPWMDSVDPRSICSVIPAPWTDDCRECIIPTCWYCIWLDFPFHVIGFKWFQFADSKSNYPSVPCKPKPYLRWFTTAPRLLMIGGLKMSLGIPHEILLSNAAMLDSRSPTHPISVRP